MVALQQLPDIPNISELPLTFTSDIRNLQNEQSLVEVDKRLLTLEEGIEIIEMCASGLLELELDDSPEPPLSEQRAAHLIAGVKRMPGVKRDIAILVVNWDKMVDRRGNWRGTDSLSKTSANRLKKLNTRTRRLGNRVKKWDRFIEKDIIGNLLVQAAKGRELSNDEKIQLLHTIPDHRPIDNPISLRRADWYGDDD